MRLVCIAAVVPLGACLRPSPAPGSVAYATQQDGALGRGAFLDSDWRQAYVSVDAAGYEREVGVEATQGAIPEDLRGTLYRCSPGNFERGGERYKHVLDGDGFVLRVDVRDGGATVNGRFVETPAFREEREADKVLYRNTFGTQPKEGNFLNANLKNVANTNCVAHGGRLLALWEAGAPFELDTVTLETLGEATDLVRDCTSVRGVTLDGGGELDDTLGFGDAHTAHPHVDPATNNLVSFTWAQQPITGDMRLTFTEKDEHWRDTKDPVRLSMAGCTLAPHDFGLTERYHVVVENRMTMDMAAFALGFKGAAQALEMDTSNGARVHLVPRDGGQPVVVDIPPFFCIHVGLAYDSLDGTVSIVTSGWDLEDEAEFPGGDKVPFLGSWSGDAPDFDRIPPTWLFETVVDPASAKLVSHGVLTGAEKMCIEHPHHDPRTATPKFVFASLCNDVGVSSPPQGYAKFDLSGDEAPVLWYAPGGRAFCEELVVVPKASADERDDAVWLLGLAYDPEADETSLLVLDGADLAHGPVATVPLPRPIPHGLHGCFAQDPPPRNSSSVAWSADAEGAPP